MRVHLHATIPSRSDYVTEILAHGLTFEIQDGLQNFVIELASQSTFADQPQLRVHELELHFIANMRTETIQDHVYPRFMRTNPYTRSLLGA